MSTTASTIFFGQDGFRALDQYLVKKQPSKTFVLVDDNTSVCLPTFTSKLTALDVNFEILEIPAGEDSKSLELANQLWLTLLEYGADRNALLINLGGGVVGDLGGFVAATFKRGISFIQVPTSLLAMVDASVGGKTGINIGGLKNQVGTFSEPDLVVVDASFLSSLPQEEWESGHGEMIKHALLTGNDWPEVLNWTSKDDLQKEIQHSVAMKAKVVEADFKESGLRKILNLGHTFGHAWESLMRNTSDSVAHGRAVIQGLHVALVLSQEQELQAELAKRYTWTNVSTDDFEALWHYQMADKKNENAEVQFVLLESIGSPTFSNIVTLEDWSTALLWLNQSTDVE
ncbi:MAG TPA: 3-dehydroquinate synthase [Cryomorphaceae bacterium]|nr:3-dehydroquinate synthase [Cryomorphaceae bacterium]